MGKPPMTYAGTGVNYDAMDPFKRSAQAAAKLTAANALHSSVQSLESTRGESAPLVDMGSYYLSHVEEGLGTKNLVADAMYSLMNGAPSYYDNIAQCTLAMIANDVITIGALPITAAMHLAVGESSWFEDERRTTDLVNGFRKACDLAGCIWVGGETPTLKGIIQPGTAMLSGSVVGMTVGKQRIRSDRLRGGDLIVFLTSSGIHANGLTLARTIADQLTEGYLTELGDTNYGNALLEPTHIYVDTVADLLRADVEIPYAVNVTGHGWRKLMRANEAFTYVVDELPDDPNGLFAFIQEHGNVDEREMFGNFNMGVGFALFIHPSDIERFWKVFNSKLRAYQAFVAGRVVQGPKRVLIVPKKIEYGAEELAVR